MEGANSGSVVFGVVEPADEEEEEEDDIQRKQELHQLLSEQLPDNLLDDSVCTLTSVEDGELSGLSTPTQDHTDFADVTLNVSMETPMIVPQVMPSHDCHMTPPAPSTDHTPQLELSGASYTSPTHTSGTEPEHQLTPRMEPGQIYVVDPDPQLMTAPSGMESGQPIYFIGMEPEQQQLNDRAAVPHSDVFSGTSQAYASRHNDARFNSEIHPPPLPPPPSGGGAQNIHAPRDYDQLVILHTARGRQLDQFRQQLQAVEDDRERHVRILRHEKELVSQERDELAGHAHGAESARLALEAELAGVKGQLTAEQTHRAALEDNKRELLLKLHSSEATVEALTAQVKALAGGEAVGRVREGYSAALEEAAWRHKEEMAALEGDKDAIISQLRQELEELSKFVSSQPRPGSDRPASPVVDGNDSHTSSSRENSIAQQLDFESGDGVRGEGVTVGRVVTLAAQVEDLSFQLSTAREELENTLQQLSQTEAALAAQRERSQAAMLSREEELGREMELIKNEAEDEKRAALEQCHQACLRLHEDATRRVKQTLELEKEQLQQAHSCEVARLREELVVVQEQYVAVCKAKDEVLNREETAIAIAVATALEKARADWVIEKEEAVGVAKTEWRRQLTNESTASVEQALEQHHKSWKEKWRRETAKELEERQREFIASAHREWRRAQESVSSAELERTRRRWAEEEEERMKAVKAECKAEFEVALSRNLALLTAEHATEKQALLSDLQALEERLVVRESKQDRGTQTHLQMAATSSTSCQTSATRPSVTVDSSLDVRLSAALQNSVEALKSDMQQLLSQLLAAQEARWKQEVVKARESTAQQLQDYYLDCLNQLVNGEAGLARKSRDSVGGSRDQKKKLQDSTVGLHVHHGESHDQKRMSHDSQQLKPRAAKTASKKGTTSRHSRPAKPSGGSSRASGQPSGASGQRFSWLSSSRH